MKYTASTRYDFGWHDARASMLRPFPVDVITPRETEFSNAPTETLRNLWMARFGVKAVSLQRMYELRDEPIVGVAQELANRKHVVEESHRLLSEDLVQHYYVLRNEPLFNHGNY